MKTQNKMRKLMWMEWGRAGSSKLSVGVDVLILEHLFLKKHQNMQ